MSSLTLLFILPILSHINADIVTCYSGDCACPALAPTPQEECTLDCGSEDVCKGGSLKCRDKAPCIVRCDAKSSCSDGTMVNGFTATDVTVLCGGDNGCKGGIEIICGTGDCTLNCFGSTSCDEFGEVFTEISKSFTCNGICPTGVPPPFSASPTNTPTRSPTPSPTGNPIPTPTMDPTPSPTPAPTHDPTNAPTSSPTKNPTPAPTLAPTRAPSITPSVSPTTDPTIDPTSDPTADPTIDPTSDPTFDPTKDPTMIPTSSPSSDPTPDPTNNPSTSPTTSIPTETPTADPTMEPTSGSPTTEPTTSAPSSEPILNTEEIVVITDKISILAVAGGESNDPSTVVISSVAIFGVIIAVCTIIVCIRKRQNNYLNKPSMVPSVEPQQTEIVEIIEGATASSFYTITVHFEDDKFNYKLIGDIGNTGDTDNCHWNETTFDNFIGAIAKQFGLEWGGFALFERVDGMQIDIEEMDDIIAGFDADGGKEMSVFVKDGFQRKHRKVTRESIHLYHGHRYDMAETTAIMAERSETDSYEMILPRPDSNDTFTMTDSNN